jgi:hypothetical protein
MASRIKAIGEFTACEPAIDSTFFCAMILPAASSEISLLLRCGKG